MVDSPKPPVRLPLDSDTDTVARIRSKKQSVEPELEDWLSVALSPSHDDIAAAK